MFHTFFFQLTLNHCTGPAPTEFTDYVYDLSTKISSYKMCKDLNVDFSKTGVHSFTVGDDNSEFVVEVGQCQRRDLISLETLKLDFISLHVLNSHPPICRITKHATVPG